MCPILDISQPLRIAHVSRSIEAELYRHLVHVCLSPICEHVRRSRIQLVGVHSPERRTAGSHKNVIHHQCHVYHKHLAFGTAVSSCFDVNSDLCRPLTLSFFSSFVKNCANLMVENCSDPIRDDTTCSNLVAVLFESISSSRGQFTHKLRLFSASLARAMSAWSLGVRAVFDILADAINQEARSQHVLSTVSEVVV